FFMARLIDLSLRPNNSAAVEGESFISFDIYLI
ncbi:MAG: hypothetical protein UV02_C0053G0001, partial [Candidatus Kuenenbacteria bacterium GW2011_GWA2_42_15]